MQKEKTFYDILHQSVGRMGFSIKVIYGCQICKIETVFDLIQRMQRSLLQPIERRTQNDLDFLRVFGRKSIKEISTNLLLQGIDYKIINLKEFRTLSPTRKAVRACKIILN